MCSPPLNFNAIFEFLVQFSIRCILYIIVQKGVDDFEKKHKTCIFLVRGAVPPEIRSQDHPTFTMDATPLIVQSGQSPVLFTFTQLSLLHFLTICKCLIQPEFGDK